MWEYGVFLFPTINDIECYSINKFVLEGDEDRSIINMVSLNYNDNITPFVLFSTEYLFSTVGNFVGVFGQLFMKILHFKIYTYIYIY